MTSCVTRAPRGVQLRFSGARGRLARTRAPLRLSPRPRRVMEHALTYRALAGGEVDVMDVFSTDGQLERLRLRILEDDRRLLPGLLGGAPGPPGNGRAIPAHVGAAPRGPRGMHRRPAHGWAQRDGGPGRQEHPRSGRRLPGRGLPAGGGPGDPDGDLRPHPRSPGPRAGLPGRGHRARRAAGHRRGTVPADRSGRARRSACCRRSRPWRCSCS